MEVQRAHYGSIRNDQNKSITKIKQVKINILNALRTITWMAIMCSTLWTFIPCTYIYSIKRDLCDLNLARSSSQSNEKDGLFSSCLIKVLSVYVQINWLLFKFLFHFVDITEELFLEWSEWLRDEYIGLGWQVVILADRLPSSSPIFFCYNRICFWHRGGLTSWWVKVARVPYRW